MTNNMIAAARYYMTRLEKAKHVKSIENEMPKKIGMSGKVVREWLLANKYMEITGFVQHHSGKKFLIAKATGKPLPDPETVQQIVYKKAYWEDGTPRSQDNWFNWREMSQGLFSRMELANDRTTAYRS